MPTRETERKAAYADRLLNDPDLPLDPAKVWALMDEVASLARNQADGLRSFGPKSMK